LLDVILPLGSVRRFLMGQMGLGRRACPSLDVDLIVTDEGDEFAVSGRALADSRDVPSTSPEIVERQRRFRAFGAECGRRADARTTNGPHAQSKRS